ncbi:MAG: transposase [Lachnospiraceae bacterium]|nr:transposase [Lachnospiraceae bacterium]
MILTEEHSITYESQKDLFREIDHYCYLSKNLSNAVNYLVKQCYRIHRKLKLGEIPDSWEKGIIYHVNRALHQYNLSRSESKQLRYIDENNGFIADAYFLSYYMKKWDVYREMPYATCSQICIQEKCREWKSYFRSIREYRKHPDKYLGCPRTPGYLDPEHGRGRIVITSQNFSIDETGDVRMPGFLSGLHIKARHRNVRQIRIQTGYGLLRIQLMYEQKEAAPINSPNVMGIDIGVSNLMAVSFSSDSAPVIINGRPLKSINQFYNKRKAFLQETAKRSNDRNNTHAMDRLTKRRNQKIRDYLHKASRKIIDLAQAENVGLIVIGNNTGWKQKVTLGKTTNQNFVSIPYHILIDMIRYKATLAGIKVKVTRESYTSGTSYLDGEYPDDLHYDRSRRVNRGLFKSNTGLFINADVNAAYQIMKSEKLKDIPIKVREQITKINVA